MTTTDTRIDGSAVPLGEALARLEPFSLRKEGPAAPFGEAVAGLEPLQSVARRWPAVLGGVLTVAMLIGLGWQLFHRGLGELERSLPGSAGFYFAFALFYVSPVWFDFVIFRRLWRVPFAGFVALLKKRIANDVLIGYSGEAYFYAWARANAPMVAAPFGAVKDVSILSAIAGNALTLLLVCIALPLGRNLLTPDQFKTALWSVAVMLAMSAPFLIFSKRVFSLQRRELWPVFWLHVGRIVAGSVLATAVWHFALPGVAWATWLMLAAARLLVGRLPLLPNKDLLFATFALVLIGQDERLTQMIALVAAMTLAAHLVLIVGFLLEAGWKRGRLG